MTLGNSFAFMDGLSGYAGASALSLAPHLTAAVGLVVLLQAALILALVHVVHRRREVRRQLEARLQFETGLLRLTLALSSAAPERMGDVLQTEIVPLAPELGIDRVWCWTFTSDPGWDSAALRAGQTVWFQSPDLIPPSLRAGCAGTFTPERGAVAAVPMTRDGVALGAVFCAAPVRRDSLTARGELLMVATTIANLIQQKRVEGELAQSDGLKGDILASLAAHVAVVDRDGTIIAVNQAWTDFTLANSAVPADATGVGANYIDACVAGVRGGSPGAAEALAIVQAACRGEGGNSTVEYVASAPDGDRWFVMMAHPLRRSGGGAVVTHLDITQRKQHEVALLESEDRFRRMADALPVAVWMADPDGSCSYLNQQWLALTGRSQAEQMGGGWIDSVHPDDQDATLECIMRAFATRQPFSIEYRVRGRDGRYRWMIDVGNPRYGSDGVFHGYVGGCIDITDRHDAERQMSEVSMRLILAQEDERRHLARELHDHLSQQLALLAFDLQQLTVTPPTNADAQMELLATALRRTAEIASDVHGMSHRLHPSKLAALGLVATIRAHCRDVSRQNLSVSFVDRRVPATLPVDADVCLFRIVEEALTNVVRHSGATLVNVALIWQNGRLLLTVADNGCGFDKDGPASSGIGLTSMHERLKALGGTLRISSIHGMGSVIEASLPCPAAAERPISIADRKRAAPRNRTRHAESA